MLKTGRFISVALLFLAIFSVDLSAQGKVRVSSDSSYVFIQNNNIVIADDDLDAELPFAILFPMFSKKRVYVTDLGQINLIGKIKEPEKTKEIMINDESVSFSEEGLFFKVIDVAPGKNVLRFKVIPQKGRAVIVNFFIRRTAGS